MLRAVCHRLILPLLTAIALLCPQPAGAMIPRTDADSLAQRLATGALLTGSTATGRVYVPKAIETAGDINSDSTGASCLSDEGNGSILLTHLATPAEPRVELQADYNGNILMRVDGDSVVVVIQYDDSPYGAIIVASNPASDPFPLHFHSKCDEPETGLCDCSYRYDNPRTTKWLLLAILGESGDVNFTAFCRNDPINSVDPLGLCSRCGDPSKTCMWAADPSLLGRIKQLGLNVQGRMEANRQAVYTAKENGEIGSVDVFVHRNIQDWLVNPIPGLLSGGVLMSANRIENPSLLITDPIGMHQLGEAAVRFVDENRKNIVAGITEPSTENTTEALLSLERFALIFYAAKSAAVPAVKPQPVAVQPPPIPAVAKSGIDFDGHILNAEVKPNGTVVGGHSTASGQVKIITGTATEPNVHGVYRAQIQVADPLKPGQFLRKGNNGGWSTMFPDSWSAAQVKAEVEAAFLTRTVNGNKWSGTTPSGVKVEGYLQPKTTVYPKM